MKDWLTNLFVAIVSPFVSAILWILSFFGGVWGEKRANPNDPTEHQEAINRVRRFLGMGHDESRLIPIPVVVYRQEYCVSINLVTCEVTRYHYHANDWASVPPDMDYAVGLTSGGTIWVHSYISYEHAGSVAQRKRDEFWQRPTFTSRFVDASPVPPRATAN